MRWIVARALLVFLGSDVGLTETKPNCSSGATRQAFYTSFDIPRVNVVLAINNPTLALNNNESYAWFFLVSIRPITPRIRIVVNILALQHVFWASICLGNVPPGGFVLPESNDIPRICYKSFGAVQSTIWRWIY